MKCPKCGYLGFETTDRCRNCQYDFSLAPFTAESELTLHGADRHEAPADFELPPMWQSDTPSAAALDLDRLFGEADLTKSATPALVASAAAVGRPPEPSMEQAAPAARPSPATTAAEMIQHAPVGLSGADDNLPFEDAPLVPPPAARPPLAVRRSTPEVPRNRPRTTRPIKADSLNFEPASPKPSAARETTETVALLLEMPSLGVRVGAGAIDLLLLAAIDAAVLFLTLRVTGLQNTLDDLRVLPPVPFVGFLAILSFGYVAAFTVAGGQTIGKMLLSLRVIGDDGRPVDAPGGMIRALGCMLVPITLGLSYLPALFTSDHRALHDRLAGTRVVQE